MPNSKVWIFLRRVELHGNTFLATLSPVLLLLHSGATPEVWLHAFCICLTVPFFLCCPLSNDYSTFLVGPATFFASVPNRGLIWLPLSYLSRTCTRLVFSIDEPRCIGPIYAIDALTLVFLPYALASVML
ncbi:hypothetical protein AAZX31_12G199900 [Glycine max]